MPSDWVGSKFGEDRRSKKQASPKSGLSGAAWRWLWQKKVFGLWRRGAALALRQRYKDEHHHQLAHHQNSVLELQENLGRLHDRRVDTDSLLQSERARVQALEAELAASQDQVKELQKRLKESFVKQFESQTRQDELESHFSKLAADFRELKAENHRFEQELQKAKADLQEAHGLNAEKENRLLESLLRTLLGGEGDWRYHQLQVGGFEKILWTLWFTFCLREPFLQGPWAATSGAQHLRKAMPKSAYQCPWQSRKRSNTSVHIKFPEELYMHIWKGWILQSLPVW